MSHDDLKARFAALKLRCGRAGTPVSGGLRRDQPGSIFGQAGHEGLGAAARWNRRLALGHAQITRQLWQRQR
ncbi:MAG: hypothetical protein U0521_23020 [Anaerolineae bacterium]